MGDKGLLSTHHIGYINPRFLWHIYDNNYFIFIDWQVITAKKQRLVDIDNVLKNARLVSHEYVVGNIVFMYNNGIYL